MRSLNGIKTFKTPAILIAFVAASSAFAQGTAPAQNAPKAPPAMQPKEGPGADVKGSIVMPRVFFVSPKDGETVKATNGEVSLKFGLEGMKIAQAGQIEPGTGHHHVIVDGGPVAKGEVVATDDKHMHFGKGQTEAKLKLAPGAHTLTLQFADGAHRSYGESMSQTIKITVK